MSYNNQGFYEGMILEHTHLINMENGIISKQDKLVSGQNIKTLNGISLIGTGDISIEDGFLVDNAIIIYTDNVDGWERKTISSSGVESTTGIGQSNIMHKTKFKNPVYLIPKGDIMYALVTYNEDGSFKARSSWLTENDGTQMLTDEHPFQIVVASGSVSDLTVAEMLTRFILQNVDPDLIEEDVNTKALEAKIKYLNYIQCCDFSEKMVHFSCDDTHACLYDLTKNKNTYSSIFENSFFNSLKVCHDETGACFTLMVMNTKVDIPDYDVSNVPSKFQAEFQANKSWLRFAFHAEEDNKNLSNVSVDAALASYNRFVSAMYQLTGDYDCIDPMPRLHNFASTLENALALKNVEHGIIGLLSADDTRTSYYLTKEQSEIARLKGKYYDLDNELIFIKTLNRNWSTAKADFDANPMFRKIAEFFWHETEGTSSVRPWVTTAAKYCNELGFIHGFPCDLYKPVV